MVRITLDDSRTRGGGGQHRHAAQVLLLGGGTIPGLSAAALRLLGLCLVLHLNRILSRR